jgi:hypothetical protein
VGSAERRSEVLAAGELQALILRLADTAIVTDLFRVRSVASDRTSLLSSSASQV